MRGLPKGFDQGDDTTEARHIKALTRAKFGKFGPSNDELSCRTLRRAPHELRPTASRTGTRTLPDRATSRHRPRRLLSRSGTRSRVPARRATASRATANRDTGSRATAKRATVNRATASSPRRTRRPGRPVATVRHRHRPLRWPSCRSCSASSGFLCCGLFLLSIGALVTGFLARKQIGESQGRLKGGGMATAGLILGAVAHRGGHHLLGADRGRRIRQQHVRRHQLIEPPAGRPGPAQGASQLPAGRLRSTAKTTITTAAPDPQRGVSARPVGRRLARPCPLRPAQPPERQHRDHRDEDQVAARGADNVAVGEVVDRTKPAAAGAGLTGEHEPRAEPPAARAVRVAEVQRDEPADQRPRAPVISGPRSRSRLVGSATRVRLGRPSPQCLVSPCRSPSCSSHRGRPAPAAPGPRRPRTPSCCPSSGRCRPPRTRRGHDDGRPGCRGVAVVCRRTEPAAAVLVTGVLWRWPDMELLGIGGSLRRRHSSGAAGPGRARLRLVPLRCCRCRHWPCVAGP